MDIQSYMHAVGRAARAASREVAKAETRAKDLALDSMARAVERGGSTLRDFSNVDGQGGYFQLEAMVYGRAGEACRVCATPIRQVRQGQRSTFYCPHCQKY